ncbi:hypothetical protein BC332_23904 [Capsicum chinense]|nr:hypothetical protein BC332_23904 [Capsicum chinense]
MVVVALVLISELATLVTMVVVLTGECVAIDDVLGVVGIELVVIDELVVSKDWPVSDSLEKGTEHEDEYMISEKELLANRLEDAGYAVGAQIVELLSHREKVADSLEKGTEHEDEYLISENEFLVNWEECHFEYWHDAAQSRCVTGKRRVSFCTLPRCGVCSIKNFDAILANRGELLERDEWDFGLYRNAA